LCRPVADLIYRRLEGLRVSPSSIPAYSAATTKPFPADAEKLRTLLADNAVLPVHMRSLFSKLYDDGARIFVQLGGGGKIAAPIRETLGDRPFAILPLDVANRHPLHQLQHVIASLYAHHTLIKTDMLFDFRKGHLNRSTEEKSKRSEFVVKLNTTNPKFQIQNERLGSAQTAGESETAACSASDSMSDAQSMQNAAACQAEAAALLNEQMNTMTRMYAMQKEDEIAEFSHFTNMLQCQAQLLASQCSHSQSSMTEALMDRCPEDALVKAGRSKPHQSFTRSDTAAQQHFLAADEKRLAQSLPFIDKIEAHTVNQEMIIRRKIGLSSDLFLQDHAFIPCPNDIKPQEEKLPTLPMAVALEIISEAAQALFPAKTVCGLKNIQNKSWINLTERLREKELVVRARVDKTATWEEVEVNCTIAVAPDERKICFAGTVLLADGLYSGYPCLFIDVEPEATHRFDTIDPKTLYRPGALYHGPCFQGLDRLLEVSDSGVEALLRVPSANGFFGDRRCASMILPAQTIDVASQLICCYDLAVQTANSWVAPVSIDRILRCGPSPAPGAEVRSRLIIRSNDANLVVFDMLLETHGEIFMAIIGWRDWRMKWSRRLLASWQNPSVNLLARRNENRTGLSKNDDPVYAIAPEELSGIDPDWLARFYLNASEYEKWRRHPRQRQIDHLTTLIAVKDLSRAILQQKKVFLYPCEVATRQLSEGRFSARIAGEEPSRSIDFLIQTAKQNNESVAMTTSEPMDDTHES
jgi:malonyl CoA-acyl carrier protein transacylase